MSKWNTVTLAEIADIRFSNVDKKTIAGETPVRLCNYMDVYSNNYITKDLPFMEATASAQEIERFKVEKGDNILTKDSETPDDIGITAVVVDEISNLVCGYHLALIKPKREKVDPVYLSKQLGSTQTAIYFSRLANGSTRYGLSSSAISSTRIPLAPLAEQRHIASVLSELDKAIEKTEALIAKYQQIKAGLMHDLFTRGVTADGELRPSREQAPELYHETPIGWIPKGWAVKPLSAVMDFLDGKRIPLKEDDRAKMPGHIPYYGASGIIDYIDKWLFDDDLILLGEDGENIVSRNLPLAFKVTGKCWVNNHAHVLKPKAGHSVSYWTEQLEWKDYAALTSGSAQPKITQGKLAKMMVMAPSFAEQEAISERTESMGRHIATEKAFLGKLRQVKLGLMLDLLTGKVTVEVHRQENTI